MNSNIDNNLILVKITNDHAVDLLGLFLTGVEQFLT